MEVFRLLAATFVAWLCAVCWPVAAQEPATEAPSGIQLLASGLSAAGGGGLASALLPDAVIRSGLEAPVAVEGLPGLLGAGEGAAAPVVSEAASAGEGAIGLAVANVQVGETKRSVAVCSIDVGGQEQVAHVQIGLADGAPDQGSAPLDALVQALAAAWTEANVDGWLKAFAPGATVCGAADGRVVSLDDYKAAVQEEWSQAAKDGSLTETARVLRGTTAALRLTGVRGEPPATVELAVVLAWADGQWSVTHLAWCPLAAARPSIGLPFSPALLGGLKTPYIEATALPNFHYSRLDLLPSRRNHPCVAGDVVLWQDSIIRNDDYDIWGLHLPSGGVFLINAPAPSSNQTFPAVSDTGAYAIWTDDGAKTTGIDLYGISLRKATAVPTGAPLRAGRGPNTLNVGGQELQRPFSDPVVAGPGSERHCRISGYRFVFTADESGTGRRLMVGDLRQWPPKPLAVPVPAAVKPACPDLCDNWVVWQDWRNGNWDVYAYDMETGREVAVCTAPGDQIAPRVSAGVVVWQDGRFDPTCRGDEPPQCDDPGRPLAVRAAGAPQEKAPDDPHWWVFAADLVLGIEIPVAGYLGAAMEPDIDGMMLVWRQKVLEDWDVFLMHLALPVPIALTLDTDSEYQPSVYQNRVAWVRRAGDAEEIWVLWWEPAARENDLLDFVLEMPRYAVDGGSHYHRAYCWMLLGSQTARPVSDDEIADRGLKPCPVCQPK